ncbi:hypothetical protein F892_03084 [Acinetobacter vivianii]|uniref:Uncharacterized protein n=1 Tax=Acinetobacter vivianii TaxID=1776742 RepID=N9PR54_9GAMM|nr:hypothetical protein [Acinetobacter vivianii]ENX20161.1 hypothetical protein F892_03084 [Acinetobacter vivianii]GGI59392.1 hypothetical protein GCM10011446_08870 [Acinetobacter vivianii]
MNTHVKAVKQAPYAAPRQRLWTAIRKSAAEFTAKAVCEEAKMKYASAHDYIKSLELAGFIQETRREQVEGRSKAIQTIFYKLINDVGYTAPMVRKNGEIVQEMSAHQAIWNTLRITGHAFTADEIAKVSSTDTLEVKSGSASLFLKALLDAGYVRITKQSTYRKNGQAKYQLKPNMNTGVKPPSIRRAVQVFDYNLNKIMFQDTPILEEERKYGLSKDEELKNE